MASASQFTTGLGVGVLLSLLLLALSSLLTLPALHSHVLSQVTSLPFLSSSLLLPLLFFLLYTSYILHYSPYYLSLPLSWADKSRHSKRNLAPLPPPYPNAFYRVATLSTLRPSAVRPLTLLTTDLVLYRPRSLLPPVILDAYCPHLGAHLGYGGKVIGDEIECPFHGWRFNREGKCTAIPYAEKVPDIAKTGKWEVRTGDDGVWVWWDVDRKPVGSVGVDPQAVDTLKGVGSRLIGEMEAEVGGHLREVWEGLLDGGRIEPPTSYGVRWVKERVGRGSLLRPVMRLQCVIGGTVWYTTHLHYHVVSPTHCQVTVGGSDAGGVGTPSLFLSITPQSAFVHSVHVGMYAVGGAWGWGSLLGRRLMLWGIVQVMREEVVRVSNKREGELEGRLKGVESGDVEPLTQFREWFASFYSKEETRKRDGVEW